MQLNKVEIQITFSCKNESLKGGNRKVLGSEKFSLNNGAKFERVFGLIYCMQSFNISPEIRIIIFDIYFSKQHIRGEIFSSYHYKVT